MLQNAARACAAARQICPRVPHIRKCSGFVFTPDNFVNPDLPAGLEILEVKAVEATPTSLEGFGLLVDDPHDFTVADKTFQITTWPHTGWRPMDPQCGDEAGTVEGDFECHWVGDFFYGKNLAIATENNTYLDGLGAPPETATHDEADSTQSYENGGHIYLWMSDHHPCGGQLFWPYTPTPFTVALGKNTHGDDIKPHQMKAFHVPSGKGLYIHPGTWHNGIYVAKQHTPATLLTRQSAVHARISCSWANEFNTLLRVKLAA